jgi:hypothetical protein
MAAPYGTLANGGNPGSAADAATDCDRTAGEVTGGAAAFGGVTEASIALAFGAADTRRCAVEFGLGCGA